MFLKAADLLTTSWRDTLNASTMLGQSKTVFQAEIDSACELIDFWRFNVAFAADLVAEQPVSTTAMWNQSDYRGLEGFVYAVSPFNFTAIGGNLPTTPALMGNTVVWKPAASAMLSAYYTLRLLEAAGLPPGVINFVPGDPVMITKVALDSPELAGIHFTGSTAVFQSMWKHVGANIGSTARTRGWSARPAARTSSSSTPRPIPRRSRWRWCAAGSSTRARSARRPAASTCRSRCGPRSATGRSR